MRSKQMQASAVSHGDSTMSASGTDGLRLWKRERSTKLWGLTEGSSRGMLSISFSRVVSALSTRSDSVTSLLDCLCLQTCSRQPGHEG